MTVSKDSSVMPPGNSRVLALSKRPDTMPIHHWQSFESENPTQFGPFSVPQKGRQLKTWSPVRKMQLGPKVRLD